MLVHELVFVDLRNTIDYLAKLFSYFKFQIYLDSRSSAHTNYKIVFELNYARPHIRLS